MEGDFITEGRVRILRERVVGKIDPPDAETRKRRRAPASDSPAAGTGKESTLFYNPAQVFNRDLSLLVIKVFGQRRIGQCLERFNQAGTKRHVAEEIKGLRICEPLAATGLRSLRYAKELPRSIFRKVTTSDIDSFAVQKAEQNRILNDVPAEEMQTVCADAAELLNAGRFICGTQRWDVVDLDPYGTATPYVDGAVRAVRDGGLLCVTCTDMPVLGGNAPEVAFYKYGGNTVKARYLHEMALRLVVHQLQMAAGKYRRIIVPLLCLSVDFYVRIFVQIWDKPHKCSEIASQTTFVEQCTNCDNFNTISFGRTTSKSESCKKRKLSRREQEAKVEAKVEEPTGPTEPAAASEGAEESAVPAAEESSLPRVMVFPGEAPAAGSKYALGRMTASTLGHKCPECESSVAIGGPFYAGPLHDMEFVDALLAELKKSGRASPDMLMREETEGEELLKDEVHQRIQQGFSGESKPVKGGLEDVAELATRLAWVAEAEKRFNYEMQTFHFDSLSPKVHDKLVGVLSVIKEELPDVPLHYKLASICNDAHISMIKLDKFKSALLHLGYRVGLFHREPGSIKTDAPSTIIFDIMRVWIAKEKEKGCTQLHRVPARYLAPPKLLQGTVDFSYHPDLNKDRPTNQVRFPGNPTAHWGPGRRAGAK